MDSSNSSSPIASGAVLWSASETERATRPLLVLLHGYGSYEGDLFQLSPYLPLEPVIASLRAPFVEGQGYSWYSLETAADEKTQGTTAAAQGVLDWLDTLPSHGPVSLFGFSQGGAVALQAMRLAPERFESIVALSTYVAPGDLPNDERLRELRPPVFWGRGTADPVIPLEAVARTLDWLPSHSNLTERIYEGLDHSVSQPELSDLSQFLKLAAAQAI
jgi:phospholipase/carboxylesterase